MSHKKLDFNDLSFKDYAIGIVFNKIIYMA